MGSRDWNGVIPNKHTREHIKRVITSLSEMKKPKSYSRWNLWGWGKIGCRGLYLWYHQKRHNKSSAEVMQDACHLAMQRAYTAIEKIKPEKTSGQKQAIEKVFRRLSIDLSDIVKGYGYFIEQTYWSKVMLSFKNIISSFFHLSASEPSKKAVKSKRSSSNASNTQISEPVNLNEERKDSLRKKVSDLAGLRHDDSIQGLNGLSDNNNDVKNHLSVIVRPPNHQSMPTPIKGEDMLRQKYKILVNRKKALIGLIKGLEPNGLRDEEAINTVLQFLNEQEKVLNSGNLPLNSWLKQYKNKFFKKFHPDRRQNQSNNHSDLQYKISIHTYNEITKVFIGIFKSMLEESKRSESNDLLSESNDLLREQNRKLKEIIRLLEETLKVLEESKKQRDEMRGEMREFYKKAREERRKCHKEHLNAYKEMNREVKTYIKKLSIEDKQKDEEMKRERIAHQKKMEEARDEQEKTKKFLLLKHKINAEIEEKAIDASLIRSSRLISNVACTALTRGNEQLNLVSQSSSSNLCQPLLKEKAYLKNGPVLSKEALCKYLKHSDTPFFPVIQHWFPNGLVRGNTDYVKVAKALWAINYVIMHFERAKVMVNDIVMDKTYKLKSQQEIKSLPPKKLEELIKDSVMLLPVFKALFPDYTVNGVNYEALLTSNYQSMETSYNCATAFINEKSSDQSKTVNKQIDPVVVLLPTLSTEKNDEKSTGKNFNSKVNLFKSTLDTGLTEVMTTQPSPTLAPESMMN